MNPDKRENLIGFPFNTGVPVKPDVDKLIEKWPIESMQEGVKIPYDLVCGLIRTEYRSSRYGTVTNSWRRRLWREKHLVLECQPLERCFMVLDDAGKVEHASSRIHRSRRSVGRCLAILRTVDPNNLDDALRQKMNSLLECAWMDERRQQYAH